MIGDAGVPGGGSDISYTGEADGGGVLDYARGKARELQTILIQADETMTAMGNILSIAGLDDDIYVDALELLREMEGKRDTLRATADAINAVAATVNGVGGRFPQLSIPRGLGLGPLVIGAAGLAALAAVSALGYWIKSAIDNAAAIARRAASRAGMPPEMVAELEREELRIAAARDAADASPLSQIASGAKWIALGIAAWVAWKMWSDRNG